MCSCEGCRTCCKQCYKKQTTRPWSLCSLRAISAVTIQVVFLVIGIVLRNGTSSQYGQIVSYETDQWSKGAITDFITSDPLVRECPQDYELIPAIFFGVRMVCYKNGDYHLGSCGNKEGGVTYHGIPITELKQYGNTSVCIKRNNDLTYHRLMEKRSDGFCSGQPAAIGACGSSTFGDKNYCLKNVECPINALTVSSAMTLSIGPNALNKKIALRSNLNAYYEYDNSQNNPLVDIYISPSQPCGIRMQDYMLREHEEEIADFFSFDNSNCMYNEPNRQTHEMYKAIGWREIEYNVYNLNDLLGDINDKSPVNRLSDFKLNQFQTYYKSFAHWTRRCQEEYSTKDINEMGNVFKDLHSTINQMFIVGIVFFCFSVFYWFIFSLYFRSCAPGGRCLACIFSFGIFGEFVLSFALIITTSITLATFGRLNQKAFKFFSEQQCSDGPLQVAFDKLATGISNDSILAGINLLFAGTSLFAMLLGAITQSSYRERCCKKCFTPSRQHAEGVVPEEASIQNMYARVNENQINIAPIEAGPPTQQYAFAPELIYPPAPQMPMGQDGIASMDNNQGIQFQPYQQQVLIDPASVLNAPQLSERKHETPEGYFVAKN